jgi:hypothetical protein
MPPEFQRGVRSRFLKFRSAVLPPQSDADEQSNASSSGEERACERDRDPGDQDENGGNESASAAPGNRQIAIENSKP